MGGRKAPEAERREQLLMAAYAVAVRDGLDAVTTRAVAAEARVSPGLVFFHFGSKEGLLLELLEELLAGALDAEVTPQIAALSTALDRMLALLRIELEGLPRQRPAVELFFAYWVGLARNPLYRDRIGAALDRYRRVFEPVCADLAAELSIDVPADTLATVVVSFVQGCAVQAVREPDRFDVEELMPAVAALLRLPSDGTTRAGQRATTNSTRWNSLMLE